MNTTTDDDNHDIGYIVLCVKKEALHTLEHKELLFSIGHELGHIIHAFHRKCPKNFLPEEWRLFEKEADLYGVEVLGNTEGAVSLFEKYQAKRSRQSFYLIASSMLCTMVICSTIPAVTAILYAWYRNDLTDFKHHVREQDRIAYIKEYAEQQGWECNSEGHHRRSTDSAPNIHKKS